MLGMGGKAAGSDLSVEDETSYDTDSWRISLDNANNKAWFGGDNLGAEAIDDSDNQDFADGTINEWIVSKTGGGSTGTCAYSNANLDGADDKQGLLTSNADDTLYASLPSTAMTLAANTLYKIVANVHVPAGNTLKTVHFAVANLVGSSIVDGSTVLVAGAYQTIIGYITLATDIVGNIMVGFDGNPTDGDLLYFDDITIKPCTSPADYADTGAFLVVTDGGGNTATGYIGEAGSGETLGSELLTNPSFDADTTGWDAFGSSLLASVAGGVSNNALRVTENGGAIPYASDLVATVLNKEYKQSVWVKQGTESTYRLRFESTNYSHIELNGEATGTWVYFEWYGRASDANERISLHQVGAAGGSTLFFDEVSFKEITEPNPNSVMIYKEGHLATEEWLVIDASFDPNDIASFIIYQ